MQFITHNARTLCNRCKNIHTNTLKSQRDWADETLRKRHACHTAPISRRRLNQQRSISARLFPKSFAQHAHTHTHREGRHTHTCTCSQASKESPIRDTAVRFSRTHTHTCDWMQTHASVCVCVRKTPSHAQLHTSARMAMCLPLSPALLGKSVAQRGHAHPFVY